MENNEILITLGFYLAAKTQYKDNIFELSLDGNCIKVLHTKSKLYVYIQCDVKTMFKDLDYCLKNNFYFI